MVGGELQSIRRLGDRHRGAGAQQLDQQALVLRREMLDQHERHAAVGRHGGEEGPERLQPARRGADPDDQARFDGRGGEGRTRRRLVRRLAPRNGFPLDQWKNRFDEASGFDRRAVGS